MAEKRVHRRLAAILAADLVGYSRLMGADEEGTITRQKTHRSELIDPAIAEHDGRIVKTTGDGLLVEFPSVVDAVRCAVAIQRAMVEREADVPEERRIRYRVGEIQADSTMVFKTMFRTHGASQRIDIADAIGRQPFESIKSGTKL